MMRKYIFDVDGTLTPSRASMVPIFQEWFKKFASENSVYLVTGSDRKKTLEQVGHDVYNLCKKVYQCAGNDVWEGDTNIYTQMIEIPDEMRYVMESYLETSEFPIRSGTHLEIRPGLANFSIIGRGCTREQREEYCVWDRYSHERETIAEHLRDIFPDFDIQVAGETGIDIMLKGKDKSQIIHDFGPHDDLYFIGDKMEPGGNDYTLSLEVAHHGGTIRQVKGWNDTWEILKEL